MIWTAIHMITNKSRNTPTGSNNLLYIMFTEQKQHLEIAV